MERNDHELSQAPNSARQVGNTTGDFISTPRTPAKDSAAALNAQREKLVADISNRFMYHAPRGDQQPRYAALRDRARELALMIVDLTPISREQSLALTKLEECIMHANSAIARNE